MPLRAGCPLLFLSTACIPSLRYAGGGTRLECDLRNPNLNFLTQLSVA